MYPHTLYRKNKLYLRREITLVWLHRITTTADEDQDNCFNTFRYLERFAQYGFETWDVGKVDRRAISAFDVWCWRKPTGILWRDHNSYENKQFFIGK